MTRRILVVLLVVSVALAAGLVLLMTLEPGSPPQPASSGGAATPATITPASATPAPPVRETGPAKAPIEPPAAPVPAAPAPAATTATLRFESDVPGASVFIDRVYLGTTPVTAPNVTPGTHRLNASATGFDDIAETIEVVAGPRDILLKFKEIRLDVRVEVVHKHGIGSCTGTLIATPQGIKYDTVHAGDRFDVPLADPTTVELDFLAKNLRIKLKNGKTYNFTEVGGGADQLYAFHRDVTKAMQKQKQ